MNAQHGQLFKNSYCLNPSIKILSSSVSQPVTVVCSTNHYLYKIHWMGRILRDKENFTSFLIIFLLFLLLPSTSCLPCNIFISLSSSLSYHLLLSPSSLSSLLFILFYSGSSFCLYLLISFLLLLFLLLFTINNLKYHVLLLICLIHILQTDIIADVIFCNFH